MLKLQIEYSDPENPNKNMVRTFSIKNTEHDIEKLLSDNSFSLQLLKDSQRDTGFDILKDKKKIDKNMSKTKMCTLGKNCHRGIYCRFAHDKNELVQSNCVFGDTCKFIKKDCNNYINISKTKICKHKHTNETDDNFLNRTNIYDKKVRMVCV